LVSFRQGVLSGRAPILLLFLQRAGEALLEEGLLKQNEDDGQWRGGDEARRTYEPQSTVKIARRLEIPTVMTCLFRSCTATSGQRKVVY
jgi:hypothetical protein